MTPHPIQRRWHAEELLRLRRSSERRRYAAPHRAGRVDANPHQIEAVVFALSRLPDGGCILADEVGLGKTIEAGLVIAQRLSEDARRVLLMTPKPLLGQWRQELYDLFGIVVEQAEPVSGGLDADGVLLMGREAATSDAGLDALLQSPPIDLIVVDEAHEMFAGIYKRFDRDGLFTSDGRTAQRAANFRRLVRATGAPVLLLTATPIQNTLTELWGLVHYVDRSGVLLGQLSTFREVFCDGNDRVLVAGQEDELHGRLANVVQRTLRRQAQEFLSQPFVDRQARAFEYVMSEEERSLYDDVTEYLLRPSTAAFRGNQRRLLVLSFHRRMASSTRALAASLEKVADRLRRLLQGDEQGDDALSVELRADAISFAQDLDDDALGFAEDGGEDEVVELGAGVVRDELELVESFVVRARSLPSDAKLDALLRAVQSVQDRSRNGEGSGKLVVFTESLVTQEYLKDQLVASGLVADEEITLFRGTNTGARAMEALERWRHDEQERSRHAVQPARDIAVRLALVHEFRTRSRIFVSTEAGAKGLNLQFCETVVNYDLPWNPQRIEQRIGRCHRYGQTRAVTVINLLASDNEAERLTYEILSQKLDLFGRVLDSSDVVLHEPGQQPFAALADSVGPELESELRRIYERSRSQREVVAEIQALRERLDSRRREFEETHRRTAGLIESQLDGEVRRVFKNRRAEVRDELAELDRDMQRVVCAYLDVHGIQHQIRWDGGEGKILSVPGDDRLPSELRDGVEVAIGDSNEVQALNLNHALVRAAVDDARAASADVVGVEVDLSGADEPLRSLRGRRGRLALVLARHSGLEVVDSLLPVVVAEGTSTALALADARAVLEAPMSDAPPLQTWRVVSDAQFDDAVEEVLYLDRRSVDADEAPRYRARLAQIDRHAEDRAMILRRRRLELVQRVERQAHRRDAALGATARAQAERLARKAQAELEELETTLLELEERVDADSEGLRQQSRQRRYVPPTPTRLFDVDIVFR